MKVKSLVLVLSIFALVLVAAVPAHAQFFTLTFDEAGNGSYLFNGVNTPDPGILLFDPQSGLTALAYALPENVGGGDVGVLDPNGMLSDGLRFEDINGTSYMFFFSNQDGDNIADTGIPNGGFLGFNVTENPDGSFQFLAGGGGNNIYNGQSDPDNGPPVPEPSSLLLLGTGILGVSGAARRRFHN